MADNKNMDLTKTLGTFTVGSQIKCRFQGDDVEGQVAAFNHSDRILMIRKSIGGFYFICLTFRSRSSWNM